MWFKHAILLSMLLLAACGTPAKQVEVKQAMEITDQDNVKRIAITKIVGKMRRGTIIGKQEIGAFCVPSGNILWRSSGKVNLSTEELVDVFREELEKNGWPVAGSTDNLFEGYDISGAELLIAGRITNIEAHICHPLIGFGDFHTSRGSMNMDVEWQIYNPALREIIGTIDTQGSALIEDNVDDAGYELMNISFAIAVNNLLGTNEFLSMSDRSKPTIVASPSNRLTIANEFVRYTSLDEALEMSQKGVIVIRTAGSHGSGFAVGDGEYVITNAHVVGNAEEVGIVTKDGVQIRGVLKAIDKSRDVALLEVQGVRIPSLHISNSEIMLGEQVYAVGAPIDEDLSGTVTSGIISSIRNIDGLSWIQSDTAVNPGSSGGPLLNEVGSVIGISTAGFLHSEGLNLFIPIQGALEFLGIDLNQKP